MINFESPAKLSHKMQNYFFAISFLIDDAKDKVAISNSLQGKAIVNSLQEHFKFAKQWAEQSDESQLPFAKAAEIGEQILGILMVDEYPDHYDDLVTKFEQLQAQCEECFKNYKKLNNWN